MSNHAFFISDLHFGHNRILHFSPLRGGGTTDEHNEWLVDRWNSRVQKRDVVYVLGDVAFGKEALRYIPMLRGNKRLVAGNHDCYAPELYQEAGFKLLPGLFRYKEFWLSHAPIHPDELRGKRNIHGHVHASSIDDSRYINVCVEALDGVPVSLEEIRAQ